MSELKTKLHWYVLNENFSTRKIEKYNALAYWDDNIIKARKKMKTKAELKEWLKREFMYRYWSKCECEIFVAGLFTKDPKDFQKIDIWTQLEPNLDIITDYIITTLKFKNLK